MRERNAKEISAVQKDKTMIEEVKSAVACAPRAAANRHDAAAESSGQWVRHSRPLRPAGCGAAGERRASD